MSTRPRKPGPATPAPGKLALPELLQMKARGEKIVMVTAYDAPGARLADAAGIDLILVGDTAAMVVLGAGRSKEGEVALVEGAHRRDEADGSVARLGAQVADRSDGLHTRVASASTS